jgi:DNA primase
LNIKNIDSKSILEYYSVKNLSEDSTELKFSCPFPEHPNGDRNPSSGISKKTNQYNCFSCHRKGTIVNFVAEMEGISEAVAIRYIRENFYKNGDFETKSVLKALQDKLEKPKKPVYFEPTIPDHVLDDFYVDWHKVKEAMKDDSAPPQLAYIFESKGFSPDILSEFNIGFDKKTNRITIPIRNYEGELVGIKGRATLANQFPKYKSIGDKEDTQPYYGFFTTNINNYTFGLDSAEGDLIICEGEFDAIALREKGFKGSVALGTSSMREKQARDIRRKSHKIVILLDNDEAGVKGAEQIFSKLDLFVSAKVAQCPVGIDPAEMTKEQIIKAINESQNPKMTTIKN